MDVSLIMLAIGAALAIRIVLHFVDKSRIQRELESRGAQVNSIRWNPFARGWFGEKGERHYDVTFRDSGGTTISTTCKTSVLTGVYWAEGPSTAEERPRFATMLRCLGCGYTLKSEWQFCPNCGKSSGRGS
jgi:hypothetical protein